MIKKHFIDSSMIKNTGKKSYPEINTTTTHSPISFLSRKSPFTTKSITGTVLNYSHYKSPQSTPNHSPIPQTPSIAQVFHVQSSKPGGKEFEIIENLTKKLKIREKKIQLLEEENKRLSGMKISENWERELIKRNDEVRKLESQLRYYKEIALEKNDMDLILEQNEKYAKRIEELEDLLKNVKQSRYAEQELQLKSAKAENANMKSIIAQHTDCLKKTDYEALTRQQQELEMILEIQTKENNDLKEEVLKYKHQLPMGSLIYFTQDINKIKKEVGKLLKILEDFTSGKDFTLRGLLGLDLDAKMEPAQQLAIDIQKIKTDLNKVFNLISDLHANHFEQTICRTQ